MHALVLAAGLGTRLRPLTDVRAKPAIPVAGRPMIRRILAWLATHHVTDIVVNLHHLPHTLTAVIGDGSDMSARVRYSWEPHVLGSAGGPRHALSMLGDDPFLIVNGDTLTDADLGHLARAHAESGALVTLALVPNHDPHRYGGVLLDARDHVLGFARRGVSAEGSYHFIGAQVASPEAFRTLPDGQPMTSIGGLYDEVLASRPGSIRGLVSHARFWDIGTVSDYLQTSADFALAEQPAGPQLSRYSVPAGRGLRMSTTATVRDSILWDDVVLGDGCALDRCIVTDRVRVPASARYRDMILIASDGVEPLSFALQVRP